MQGIAPAGAPEVGEQGTSPLTDTARLVLEGVSESDWDDFFATIGIAE